MTTIHTPPSDSIDEKTPKKSMDDNHSHAPHHHTPPPKLQAQHALARLLLQHLQPSAHVVILDLLKDGGAAPGDELAPHAMHGLLFEAEAETEDAPFLLRTLQTTTARASPSQGQDTPVAVKIKVEGARPLEEGVPLTGVAAAVLARCQLLRLPATALVVAVPPSPASLSYAPLAAFERRLAALVAGVRAAVGLAAAPEEEEGAGAGAVRAAAKALLREGQGRFAAGSATLYL